MRGALAICALMAGCAAQPGDLFFSGELVDFGEAIAGAEHLKSVELFNRSGGPLRLTGVRTSSPSFSLEDAVGATLAPHGKVSVSVRYTPPRGATASEEATLEVSAGDELVASLRARGTPTKPRCEVPEELEFGGVAVGHTSVLPIELENELPLDTAVYVQLTSGDGFLPPNEPLVIARGSRGALALAFTPLAVRSYEATVSIQIHALCEVRTVRLRGDGVPGLLEASRFLTWQIDAGTTEVQQVTMRNRGPAPVRLSDFQVRPGVSSSSGAEFRVTRFPLSIPGAERSGDVLVPGLATMEISFTAGPPGVHAARLTIATDLSSDPLLAFSLEGRSR